MKKTENRMKGETWYYTPCGRRMKQFPEVIKVNHTAFVNALLFSPCCRSSWSLHNADCFVSQYLKRHSDGVVSREHFSFSPRMPVGDFYEERETSEVRKMSFLLFESFTLKDFDQKPLSVILVFLKI